MDVSPVLHGRLQVIRPLGAFQVKGIKVVQLFLNAKRLQARILNYFPRVVLKGIAQGGVAPNPFRPCGLVGQRKQRDRRVDSY